LRIFDRSFAVTYWLQAVAIAIGLFGVAANFSAQVLARRKEFGLLAHLGLTRRQVLTVVAGEGMAWTLIGSLAGLAEEAPSAYKDVDHVVDVVHNAGIARKVARLAPVAVVKG
jgi:predicted lysophospholipase L1 biosynthesis ABC-type transport system permease subunit